MLEYSKVALDFMNRDHAEFVSLCEKLIATLQDSPEPSVVDQQLNQLAEHTRLHFAEEERQMQAAQFRPYRMHKGEHDRVLSALEEHIAQWRQDRDAGQLRAVIERTLNGWFVNHVNSMDFVTARFITNQVNAQAS
jgi:hemerythrin